MKMISYAQNREDVLLDRLFARGIPGFYIDVGANEPVRYSLTKHFYDLGWHGVNVEPALYPFELLRAERQRDVNLNLGISDHEGELTLHEFPPEYSGGSTFSQETADWHRTSGLTPKERKVPVITLAQLCERYVDQDIDFMSIDVEGHEGEVLAGGDWATWRPRVVLVEATQPSTQIQTHQAWEHILLEAQYVYAAFDGLNRYYVRSEDAPLAKALLAPPNVLDDYIPYDWLKQTQELTWSLDQALEVQAATRAVNSTLLTQFYGFAQDAMLLRARYERLERALTEARARAESIRTTVLGAQGKVEQLRAEAAIVVQPLEGVGPASLAVARRLTALSSQHPRAAESAKAVLRLARAANRAILKLTRR